MTVSTRRGTKDVAPSRAPSALSLTAWPTWTDITQDFDSVFSQFQRSFDEVLAPLQPRTSPSVSDERSARSPVVEVLDQGDHYTVTAELPGFSRDMVDVRVSKTGLMVRARKKEQSEDKRGDSIQRERSDYAFEERVSFPAEVDPKKLAESMKNGVLELKIPKRESPKSEKKTGAS
jgi:HSP20 family protein